MGQRRPLLLLLLLLLLLGRLRWFVPIESGCGDGSRLCFLSSEIERCRGSDLFQLAIFRKNVQI